MDNFIPLDKSWMIRVGMLDILNSCDDIIKFLEKQSALGDDLQALLRCAHDWNGDMPLDVGESGTLYRFLRFAAWKKKLNKEFLRRGTLQNRAICNDPSIVGWPLQKLLTLDDGTSQWASASILLGNKERVQNPPYKLQLTYGAVDHWHAQRIKGECWLPRYDETLKAQAVAYLDFLKMRKMNFVPRHSEDCCFARAFGLITPAEGERLWPGVRNHESDRFKHMEEVLGAVDCGEPIDSRDHRVVQAVVMRQKSRSLPMQVKDRAVVNKSWPQFWDFLEYCESTKPL